MLVLKRDNYVEEFDKSKIFKAIMSAFVEVYDGSVENFSSVEMIANRVVDKCKDEIMDIEVIQDLIEETLIECDFKKVAKAFILYRQNRTEKRKAGWNMDELQKSIYDRKYNPDNQSFPEWLNRVSGNNPKIKKLIRDKKFLFGGRILAHRGSPEKTTYSNCYVMPAPEDNLESIFDTAKYLARTYSYGGGCGTDISKLRPKGTKVHNSAKVTTGAVSFMSLFDCATGLIGQNGRRGALMLSISDTHPDLPDFIEIKTQDGSITKANISVRISDAFMNAVKFDESWKLHFEVKDTGEVFEKTLSARKLYRDICEANWDWAEPAMLFWDRITSWHMMSEHPEHEYEGVNPCAEEPLMGYGSCLIGSMNLSKYVLFPFTSKAKFDFEKFSNDVMTAVVGLNEVLDEGLNRHPLQGQRDNARDWRQIGLGVMGIADMFIKMGIEYGSVESLELSDSIGATLLNSAVMQSALLAKEYGVFPKYNKEALFKSEFFQTNIYEDVKDVVAVNGLRNSQLLTIAPTGTISTMWGISGGIEAIFDISFTRKTESLFGEDVYFEVFTPIVKEYMEFAGITDKSQLPDYIKNCTAHNLEYRKRIAVQGVWQNYIDASISSTINLPKPATVEDVMNIYMTAHKYGLKGITVFRDGCKRVGILTTDADTKESDAPEEIPTLELPSSNTVTHGDDKYVTCQECGEKIELITNGCAICSNCGWSPCY